MTESKGFGSYYSDRPWTVRRIVRGIAKYGPAALVDFLAVSATYVSAAAVRSGELPFNTAGWLLTVAVLPGALQVVANLFFQVYWRDWGLAALEDLIALAKASATAMIALLIVVWLLEVRGFAPLGSIFIAGILSVVVESAVKLRPRWAEIVRAAMGQHATGRRVIIVGAGQTGQLLAKHLSHSSSGYRVVCFADDDRSRWGTYVRGVRVSGGITDLPRLIANYSPEVVVIATATPRATLLQRVMDLCEATNVRVRAVKGFGFTDSDTAPLRAISVEELLTREAVQLNSEAVALRMSGRTVLITGAAGSIGSEICKQMATLGPERMLLLDINESGLHDLRLCLPDVPTALILADVRDRTEMLSILQRYRPDVIFHAAAYKHVPILEESPRPGIACNVLGTANLLEAAHTAGTGRFVFISSDKAVMPSSVLGLTKRLGELLTVAYARAHSVDYCSVRFGNVLGSSGSVVPLFSRQIDAGGPVTITDPDVTRYFMTAPEAAALVIHAAALTHGGDLFVLDMGTPVAITDLVRRMIRLRGLTDKDIATVFTGLRPGEKLHEQLLSLEEVTEPTEEPRLLRIRSRREMPLLAELLCACEEISDLLERRDETAAISLLRQIVEPPTRELVSA